jgi:cytochrome c-type biogenesis protein CcmE
MTRKARRLTAVLLGLAALSAAAALVLTAFEDTVVFFVSPSEMASKELPRDRALRLGGLVEEGSVRRHGDGVTVEFKVTDLAASVPVVYAGVLPDLFREGQGVVTEGRLRPDGVFEASEVLAKHDETYMPPEVAEALKQAGQWRPGQAAGASP